MTEAPVLVEVQRAGFVESVHRGHLVIVTPDAAVHSWLGDPDLRIYPRSAVKPVQAAAMLDAGLALRGSHLALASASHSGEEFHIAGVRDILADGHLSPSLLQCPADLPYDEQVRESFLAAGGHREPIVMNCSGKHAAMLRTCQVNAWPLDSYLRPDHPLQLCIRAALERLSGSVPSPVSADGCGAPLWGLPLVGLARALVRLPDADSGARVAAAMRGYPEYSGGSSRDVTHLMRGVPGLVAKDGAESVQAMVLDTEDGRYGLALKIEDGAPRARPVGAAAALAALGVRAAVVSEHLKWPVLGGGRMVGVIRPAPVLRDFAGL